MTATASNKEKDTLNKKSAAANKTKKDVLDAAIEEFYEHGLAGARVDRIAKRAKVNKQALYYHYGDKSALFEAALLFGYESTFRLPKIDWENDPRPVNELMRLLVAGCFDWAGQNQWHISLIADENRNKGKHLNKALLKTIREAAGVTISAINTLVERGKKSGDFRQDVDAEDLYICIVGQPIFYFNHQYTLSAILKHNLAKKQRAERHKQQMVDFILMAIEARH